MSKSASMRTRVRIPRTHIKLSMAVHAYNLSSPVARYEVESGELPKLMGHKAWCIQHRMITERDPVSKEVKDKD